MTEGWTCGLCSATNAEPSLVCSNCGATRPSDDVEPGGPVAEAGVTADGPDEVARVPPAPSPEWAASPPLPANQGGVGWAAPTAPTAAAVGESAPPSVPAAVPLTDTPEVPPPAARPLWRRIPIGALIFGGLIVAGLIGGFLFNAGRSSTGEINKAGDLTAADIRIGDCFDLKDPGATSEVDKVTARPCADAHEYEMIFVGSLPAGTYPPEKTFEDYVTANCLPTFATFIGIAYESSDLDLYWLYPTEDAWKGGDRSVQCAAYDPGNDALRGSLKGSNR